MSTGVLPPPGVAGAPSSDGEPRDRVDFGRRVLTLRRWGFSARLDWRAVIVCAVLALVVAAMAVLALMTGSYRLSPAQVISALSGGETDLINEIVVEWRLPRVAAPLVFGAAPFSNPSCAIRWPIRASSAFPRARLPAHWSSSW